jgi:hypothetical protein
LLSVGVDFISEMCGHFVRRLRENYVPRYGDDAHTPVRVCSAYDCSLEITAL